MRRLLPAVPLALLPLLMAACGGSSGGSSQSSSGSDEASKSPRAIVSDMAAALEKVRSYHVEGTQTDKDGKARLEGDVSASGSLRFALVLGSQRYQIVVVGEDTYVKANSAFWRSEGGANGDRLSKLLADRWVTLPQATAADVRGSLDQVLPKTLAYCATHSTGTVTKKGTQRFAGRRVVVLADKGNRPGGSPSDLYVAASGPTLPLREVQTGPQTPGKPDPRCGDATSTTTASDIRLSRFDEPVSIAAPKGASDLESLLAPGGTGQSA